LLILELVLHLEHSYSMQHGLIIFNRRWVLVVHPQQADHMKQHLTNMFERDIFFVVEQEQQVVQQEHMFGLNGRIL
jgi:hypothetical protein